jgi:hypothetical protein
MMRLMIVLVVILTSNGWGQAASNSNLGGGGLGFSCDVNTMRCTCVGDILGADCQAMKRNCDSSKGPIVSCPTGVGSCGCRLKQTRTLQTAPETGETGKKLLRK